MSMKFHSPLLTGNPFAVSPVSGIAGPGVSVDEWGQALEPSLTLQAFGGEINALSENIVSVSSGVIVPRPNGGTTLNFLDNMRAQTIAAELADGDQVQIVVNQAPQWRGMGNGVHYYLPVGPNNRFIAEPGQRHRKIYVSASGAAMDKTAIAAHATAAGEATTASQVTASWLTARPIYGGSESMPLTFAVGHEIMMHLNGRGKQSRSDWFLLERGYEYANTTRLWQQYWRGEDELHPLVIGAWGTGTRPRVIAQISDTTSGVKNVIYRDLAPVIFYPRNAMNVIGENVLMTRDEERDVHEHTIRDIRYVTYREMKIVDVWRARPGGGRLLYEDSGDRSSGLYAPSPWNFFMDGCILDHNGHGVGARADRIFDPENPTPMPPNTKSHNRYDSYGVNDNTMRNSISARSGNSGIQGRGGGQYEGCVWLDNQVNCSISYGDQADRPSASFAINYDNINMSAGKRPTPFGGANSNGYDLFGYRHSAVDCILAHAADPNNPAEIAAKGTARRALIDWPFKFNNTIVYNWIAGEDENAGGVNPTLANQTTAQLYASTVLGAPGTMEGFLLHFRDEAVNIGETVKDFVKWTQTRFGITRTTRTAAANVTFIPDARMDGFRWDNRHNWNTKELPGANVADTVNLGGNFVRFGTLECSIAALTTGGGVLPFEVTSGRLTVGTVTDASSIKVRHSGQFYCGATTAPLSVHSTSGRVRFTGTIADLSLLADGHGQVLFGSNVTARDVVLSGQVSKVGWDGTGTASLTITQKLEFSVGVLLRVSTPEFPYRDVVTGHPVQGTGWSGTLAEYEDWNGGSDNRMWISNPTALPTAGTFSWSSRAETNDPARVGTTNPVPGNMVAVVSRGISPLQRFRSGAIGDGLTEPTVTATVTLVSGSAVVITGRDLLEPGTYDLTGPGVTVVNNGATLPAGVAVVGGVLRLTV